jgi:hypothetical protein
MIPGPTRRSTRQLLPRCLKVSVHITTFKVYLFLGDNPPQVSSKFQHNHPTLYFRQLFQNQLYPFPQQMVFVFGEIVVFRKRDGKCVGVKDSRIGIFNKMPVFGQPTDFSIKFSKEAT